jgi:hypothetical protein
MHRFVVACAISCIISPGIVLAQTPVASAGLPLVLALEVTQSWWSAKDTRGHPPPDPRDELGQSGVRCASHPRRTAQARDRCRAVDSR